MNDISNNYLNYLESLIMYKEGIFVLNNLSRNNKNKIANILYSTILNYINFISYKKIFKNYIFTFDQNRLNECCKLYDIKNETKFLQKINISSSKGLIVFNDDYTKIIINNEITLPINFFKISMKKSAENFSINIQDNTYEKFYTLNIQDKKITNNDELMNYIMNVSVLKLNINPKNNIDFKKIDKYFRNADLLGYQEYAKENNIKYHLVYFRKITNEKIIKHTINNITNIYDFYERIDDVQRDIVTGCLKNELNKININDSLKLLITLVNDLNFGTINSKMINENLYSICTIIELIKFYNYYNLYEDIDFNDFNMEGFKTTTTDNLEIIKHINNCLCHKDRVKISKDEFGNHILSFTDFYDNKETFNSIISLKNFHSFVNDCENIIKLKKNKEKRI